MSQLTPPLSAEDHVDGPERAEFELVMFGDFQCPYCAAAYPIVRRIRHQMAGRLLFGFRHFPLREIHADAERAAEAAEAAAAQGAFWAMHDALFDDQGRLEDPHLWARAEALGLDLARFDADRRSPEVLELVRGSLRAGVRAGVATTPTLFVDGARHAGRPDDALWAQLLTT